MFAAPPNQNALRLVAVLVILAGAFLGGSAVIRTLETQAAHEIIAAETQEHERLLTAFLNLAAEPSRLLVEGNARRTSFTRPDEPGSASQAQSTLESSLRVFRLDTAWIVEADGRVRLTVSAENGPTPPPPITPSQLANLNQRVVHYFTEARGVVYEVNGAKLATNSVNPDAPRGWLFAARRWDENWLSSARFPFGDRLTLASPDQPAGAAPTVRIERVLRDVDQKTVRLLRLDYTPRELSILSRARTLQWIIVVALGLGCLGVIGFCLWRWVDQPSRQLHLSLSTHDEPQLQSLAASRGHLGQLAGKLRDLLADRRQLQLVIDERERLARELHDNLIQTVYTSGLNLASARVLLRQRPDEAESLLDFTRQKLTATLDDLRDFIRHLAPRSTGHRSFADALRSAIDLAQAVRPLRATFAIDHVLADSLSADQRNHLLHFARETIGNTARHGTSDSLHIALRATPGAAELTVTDTGTTFDSTANRSAALQLAALSTRAEQIGGTVTIDTQSGSGTRITFLLPHGPAV
jgi:signal transduction histidine kinase